MAIKLDFDSAKIVKPPTIVLSKRNGEKLGTIPVTSIRFTDNLNSPNSIDFKVSKEYNGNDTRLWDEIKNFKLIWCQEWDAWFEITVSIDESNELIKNVSGKSIGEAELSAIKLFNIEINTENDIATDDYVPTVLYDGFNKRASLLHRITEKAPHYKIKHVDSSIAGIQRTFTFDSTSIYDAFNEIAEEIGCLFIISQHSDSDGFPERGIYVYDLQTVCNDCGYRGEFSHTCPECGSTNLKDGYGNDTNVFVSSENLANEISLSTDTESVNTCFRLETGDDLMTATVMNCNPNGTEYLWYIPDEVRADMSDALRYKLSLYDIEYAYYQNDYQITFDSGLVTDYNSLVDKYVIYNPDIERISNSQGFKSLIGTIYNTIDFELYLRSTLMPTRETSDTDATEQARLLNSSSLSPLAVTNVSSASASTVDLNVLSLAKAIVRATYQVKIKTSSYNKNTKIWTGVLTVTNYSDESDTADTSSFNITVTDNYERFIKQKIDKLLNKENSDGYDVASLFKKSCTESGDSYTGDFPNELKKYALNPLKGFHDNCQSVLDILVEEGISDSATWLNSTQNLYNEFYNYYYIRLRAIEIEMALREQEINTITSLSSDAEKIRLDIQEILNFKNYIGETLWKEFCSYRRESLFSNSNYISDGLTNSEIIERAREFLDVAQKELIKSATLQHSISSTLSNLLVIPGFEPILDSFEVGNWIRVRIDCVIYKLRLLSYTVDFENLENLSVDFSDVTRCGDDVSDIASILSQAQSMATTYQSVERQASKGKDSSRIINTWFEDGLNATLTKIINAAVGQTMTWDSHGMLMRQYDEPSQTYSKEQLKIINSTLAITDNNWKTTKTAIGKFYYVNPKTGELDMAYGVNGETIVGKMILGSTLSLYNQSGSLTFDDNGLNITNGTNTFTVNPNNDELFTILNGSTAIFSLDENGNLNLTGNITATSLVLGRDVTIPYGSISGTPDPPDLTIYVAKDGTIGNEPADGVNGFKVSSLGVLTASNVIIYGSIYSSNGIIGGWTINSEYLGYGNIGTTNSAFLSPKGISTGNSIGGYTDANAKWAITSGVNFGVTIEGAMYCISGKIGGWNINQYSIFTGTYATGTNDGDITISSANFTRAIGGVSRSNLRLAIGANFGVARDGTTYVSNIIANRQYSILGSKNADGSDGTEFGILRGDATNSLMNRKVGLGTIFESDDYTNNSYTQPNCGISFYSLGKTSTPSYISISNTRSGITIKSATTIILDGLIYMDNLNNGTPVVGEALSKDTDYQLTKAKLYMLIIFHNHASNKGVYIIRGGSDNYITLLNATNINITITISSDGNTSYVSYSTIQDANPGGRIIALA